MRVGLGLLCAIAAVLAVQLVHAASGGKVNLARNYKAGNFFSFKVEMEILVLKEGYPDTKEEKEEEKVLVKAVGPDGTVSFAKYIALDAGGKLSGIGNTERWVLVREDSVGRVLSLRISAEDLGPTLLPPSPDYAMVEQMREVKLPGRPVAIGEMWETNVKNLNVQGNEFLVRTTLLGAEKDRGKRLWHLKQTAAMLEGSRPNSDVAICRADFWLDAETSMTVRSEVRIENSSGELTIRTKAVKSAEK